jgi:hypothetical protein
MLDLQASLEWLISKDGSNIDGKHSRTTVNIPDDVWEHLQKTRIAQRIATWRTEASLSDYTFRELFCLGYAHVEIIEKSWWERDQVDQPLSCSEYTVRVINNSDECHNCTSRFLEQHSPA